MGYTITRSNRKTMAIHITKDAAVEVRAPLKLPKAVIDKFVKSKEKWIARHLAVQAEYAAEKAGFTINYGDTVTVMGKPYTITSCESARFGYSDTTFYMKSGLDSNEIKHTCVQIYKMIAKNELARRTMYYAKRMNVAPTNIRINSANTRWGSCSGRNSINFSWRLIMAENNVIDYVVVHELAHIKEHNHSPKFWSIVESVVPDYKAHQKKLKELQTKLAKENWV